MFFPFMVDIEGRTVAVIGGGKVALRKCMLFLDYGAAVRVIAPKLIDGFEKIADRLEIIASDYEAACLNGVFAAVAATDDAKVNRKVSQDCRNAGIPVNVVDVPELCSFFVPATVRRGDMTIGISTGGKSPALAGNIRRELEEIYGEEYARRLSLLGELRDAVKKTVSDPEERRRILISAAKSDADDLKLMINTYGSRGDRI